MTNKFTYKISKENIKLLSIKLLLAIYIIIALIHELKLFSFTSQILLIIIALIIISFSSIFLYKKVSISVSSLTKNQYILSLLFIFIILNSLIVRHYLLTGALFNLVVGYIFAYIIYNNKGSTWYLLIPFTFIATYICLRLLIDPNPNNVFERSRNYISFYLIITLIPYYFVNFIRNENVSILPSIICFILSFYSLGRSGIISSLILLLCVIYYSYHSKVLINIAIGLVIVFFMIFMSSFDFISTIDYERIVQINQYIELGGRSEFWKKYFSNIDIIGLLFGVNTENNVALLTIGSYTASHIHSAILNFISVVGLFVASIFF